MGLYSILTKGDILWKSDQTKEKGFDFQVWLIVER